MIPDPIARRQSDEAGVQVRGEVAGSWVLAIDPTDLSGRFLILPDPVARWLAAVASAKLRALETGGGAK